MLLKKLVRTQRGIPLSDDQVMKMAMRHGLKSMDYEHVAKQPISKILNKPTSGVLLFFTDHSNPKRKIGHFCLLYQTPRTGINFFDPLGNSLHRVLRITQNRDGLLAKLRKLNKFTENRRQYRSRREVV